MKIKPSKVHFGRTAQKTILEGVRRKRKQRRCNLCNVEYCAQSRFELFCKNCRVNDELYHFSEWLQPYAI